MKKFIYAALATSLIFSVADGAVKKKQPTTKMGTSSVYKVSKNGHIIYLGGTVHLLRKEDYPLPAAYEKAYQASDVLTFETDTKALSSPEIGMKVMEKGMYQDDRTLEKVLSEEVYNLLKTQAAKQNIPLGMINKMKPGLAVATLSAIQMKEAGLGQEGVDIYFTHRGEEDKKNIEQLESIDSQLERITEMGAGNEDEFVKYSLQDMVGMKEKMDDLIAEWKNGRSMGDEIEAMQKDYPDLYTSLLVERNNNWMPQILSYLESGIKAFVLVGSLHLHGEDGLLRLLEKKGYTIEQQ